MKKIKLLLTSLLLVGVLCGCSQSDSKSEPVQEVENEQDSVAKILVETQDTLLIEAEKNEESFAAALEILKEEGLIQYFGSEDTMGLYLQEVNGIKAEPDEKTYWAVYTTLLEDNSIQYAGTESGSFTYEDRELGYANYGISSIPFVKGELYALVLETY